MTRNIRGPAGGLSSLGSRQDLRYRSPSEGAGRIPDAEWKESYFTDASAEDR
ncbi:MAG: hypothetical protein ACLS89_04160 [Collinsella sp.]